MEKRKIAIIGGGISGLSAGITLLQKGNEDIEVKMFEARQKGREKICGGLLTRHAYRILVDLLDNGNIENAQNMQKCIMSHIDRVNIYENYKKVLEWQMPEDKDILICDRQKVDLALTEKFIELGGNYTDHKRIDFNEMIELSKTNEMVFVASGVDKGDEQKDCGFGIEYTMAKGDVNKDTKIYWEERKPIIEIHFGVIKNGYGWVFPYGEDKVRIGLASFNKNCENEVAKKVEEFVEKIKRYNEFETDKRGAFIPREFNKTLCKYTHLEPKADDIIAFIGDRTGIIDYITGEGNYFGLEMGKSLAEIVRDKNYKPSIMKERFKNCIDIARSSKNFSKWFYKDWFRKLLWKLAILKSKADEGFIWKMYDELINRKVHTYDLVGLSRALREVNNRVE